MLSAPHSADPAVNFPITDRDTALAVFEHLRRQAASRGVELREPPPEPQPLPVEAAFEHRRATLADEPQHAPLDRRGQ